jgi:hypothetical protein
MKTEIKKEVQEAWDLLNVEWCNKEKLRIAQELIDADKEKETVLAEQEHKVSRLIYQWQEINKNSESKISISGEDIQRLIDKQKIILI